jgi:hypothetical protein
LPKYIAFVVAFLPFFLGVDLISRDVVSRSVFVRVAAGEGSYLSYVWGVMTTTVAFTVGVMLLLILLTKSAFALSPKHGLTIALLTQVASAIASASLGMAAALLAGSRRQAYGAILGYFLGLTLFGGLLWPLDASAPYIRWLANWVPLRFAGDSFYRWFNYGEVAQITTLDFGLFAAEVALAVAAMLTLAVINKRRF